MNSTLCIHSSLKNFSKSTYQKILHTLKDQGFEFEERDELKKTDMALIGAPGWSQGVGSWASQVPCLIVDEENPSLDFFQDSVEGEINLFHFSSKEVDEILHCLLFFQHQSRRETFLKLDKRSKKDLKSLYQLLKKGLEENASLQFEGDFIQKGSEILEKMFSFEDEEKRQKEIISYFNKRALSYRIEAHKDEGDYHYLLKLSGINDQGYYIGARLKRGANHTDEDTLFLCLIVYINEVYVSLMTKIGSDKKKDKMLALAFNYINTPLVMVSLSGDLLYHNSLFVDLKYPYRDCLGLTSGEIVKIDEVNYKVYRSDLVTERGEVSYFCFLKQGEMNEKKVKVNTEELGIITSSMAHELNNPLAGILAAIGYLKLEEHWSVEDRKALDEMEEGAKRCKNLVEIFLGFTRKQGQDFIGHTLVSCFSSALNLLRFRVVETNVKIQIDWDLDDQFQSHVHVNNSIFSMVLYLVLGTLLTRFSHQVIVEERSKEDFALKGIFVNQGHFLILELNDFFTFQNELQKLTLAHHLLRLENVQMSYEKRKILFDFSEHFKGTLI